MSYATVHSCTLAGVVALPVIVEVHVAGGLPGVSIVGLPQSAVRESKDRVKAAVQHAGFRFPMVKIIVNLAPADLPKQGGRFDLPIALGILIATGQLPAQAVDQLVVIGELGLTGDVRPVSGVLPTSLFLAGTGNGLLLPAANGREATRSRHTPVYGVATLSDACRQLSNRHAMSALQWPDATEEVTANVGTVSFTIAPGISAPTGFATAPDMADVRGQYQARRAFEIAAAGAHNLLMTGPPGTGKSMLASRLPGIQPRMTEQEATEAASLASITHAGFDEAKWGVRPFRSPHHTASGVALVGGGSIPMPGEVSLAHHGVLFLDELPEFSRGVLEVLREPMESGHITVSRAARQADFPARFQLVAAMNPCPCGYFGDSDFPCRCTPDQIQRYRMRISGPFLDRIDLHLQMPRLARTTLAESAPEECSATIRKRVEVARMRQMTRQQCTNAVMPVRMLEPICALSVDEHKLLDTAAARLCLSARATHRLLRVARTIADLAASAPVGREHLVEALSYRQVPHFP